MQSLGTQIASLVGAVLVLAAYVGHQLQWMRPQGVVYNEINAAGSAILTYIVLRPFQAGFVILEGSWVIISMYALLRSRRAEISDGRT